MKVIINSPSSKFELIQEPSDTIRQLKLNIWKIKQIKLEIQTLSFNGNILEDSQTLENYGIKDDTTLDLAVQNKINSKLFPKGTRNLGDFNIPITECLPKGYYNIEEVKKKYEKQKREKSKKSKQDISIWHSKIHKRPITAIIVSPDGKYLISSSAGSLKVLDFNSKTELHEFQTSNYNFVANMAVSSNSKYLACSHSEKSIKVFDLDLKAETHHIEHAFSIRSLLLLSLNDKYMIAIFRGTSIKVYDFETKLETCFYEKVHEESIISLAVSPNSKYLVSGSYDDSIKLFDLETKKELHHFTKAHYTFPTSLTFSNNNKFIISGFLDGILKIFDIETRSEIHKFYNSSRNEDITSLFVSQDDKYITSLSHSRVLKVFDFETKIEVLIQDISSKKLNKSFEKSIPMARSPNGKQMIFGFDDGSIEMISIVKDANITPFIIDNNKPELMIMSSDNKYIICGYNYEVEIFDLEKRNSIHSWSVEGTDNHYWLTSLVMSSNNKYISAASVSNLYVFDFENRTEMFNIKRAHDAYIWALAISPDNKYIISGAEDCSIKIFSIETKTEVHHLKNIHKGTIRDLVVSHDGNYIISGSEDKSIKVLDMSSKTEKFHFVDIHENKINSLVISADDKYIISASEDKSIKIFDLTEQAEIFHFKNHHQDAVYKVFISWNNKYIISVGRNLLIKIFDIETKAEIYSRKYNPSSNHNVVTVSPDNHYLAVAYQENGKDKIEVSELILPKENEIVFIKNQIGSSKIPFSSILSNYDNILLQNTLRQDLWISYQDLCILPHRWTSLHLLAIFNPAEFEKIPLYSDFKVPFLVDTYQRTPLHYLFAQNKINFNAAKIVFKYIVDYLQDTEKRTLHDVLKSCESLSNILPIIVTKLNTKYVEQYLKICFPQTPTRLNQKLPTFGKPQSNMEFSQSLYLSSEVKNKIFEDGDEQVSFRSIILYLNYNLHSYETFNLISYLSEIKDEVIFRTPPIVYLINFLWAKAYPVIVCLGVLYSVLIILVSVYIGIDQKILPIEILIISLTTFFLTFEIVQMFTLKNKYLASVWNWLDTINFLLMFALIALRYEVNDDMLVQKWISSWIIIFGYTRWASYLRLFAPTRNLIQIILSIIKDMSGFILLLGLITIGFSLIFLEFNRDQEYFGHLYDTYKLLFGDLSDDHYNLSQKIFSSLIMFIFNVVFLNLLISIMGDSYDRTQEKKVLTDSHTRLDMLQETMILVRLFRRNKPSQKGYLVICGAIRGDEDEDNPFNTEWEGRVNVIKKLIKQTEQKIIGHEMSQYQYFDLKLEKNNAEMEIKMKEIKQDAFQNKQEVFENMKGNTKELKKEITEELNQMINQTEEKISQEIVKSKVDMMRIMKSEILNSQKEILDRIEQLMKSK